LGRKILHWNWFSLSFLFEVSLLSTVFSFNGFGTISSNKLITESRDNSSIVPHPNLKRYPISLMNFNEI
jgi:hypothetical protein